MWFVLETVWFNVAILFSCGTCHSGDHSCGNCINFMLQSSSVAEITTAELTEIVNLQ
jgi:hypothetical protein